MKKSSRLKLRFLLNANISRTLIPPLSSLGFDVVHISQVGKSEMSDEEAIKLSKSQKRIIVTHDLDYGEIYYLKEQGKIGVIQLRLTDQTTQNTLKKLTQFLDSKKSKSVELNESLIVISDKKIRLFSP